MGRAATPAPWSGRTRTKDREPVVTALQDGPLDGMSFPEIETTRAWGWGVGSDRGPVTALYRHVDGVWPHPGYAVLRIAGGVSSPRKAVDETLGGELTSI